MELFIAAFVYCQFVSVGGSTTGARRWTADYRGTLIGGLVVGDFLWVVVVALLFAVITRRAWVRVFRIGRKPVIVPHGDPFED